MEEIEVNMHMDVGTAIQLTDCNAKPRAAPLEPTELYLYTV